ncbi:MAG: insulinase family protein, partial [Acidobacteriota bacterium]|nr:insulinase family protein [Acidobacteriota bacterium]
IEARTRRNPLPGGLEIALLPKKTRGETVVAVMTLRYGDEKSLINRSTAAHLVGHMLTLGTTKRTRQQLKDEFDRLKARVGIGSSATEANVFIETVRQNLPAVMRLVAEALREPSFPESEFEQLKREESASIEQGKSEPGTIASTLFSRHIEPFPKGDVRYVRTPDEQIAEVKVTTLDDVKKFYQDFYGASNAQLAVVGDFDDKEVERLAIELFSNWKSPRPFVRVVRVYKEVPVINKSIEAPDKANAFFIAGLNFKARDDNPDYPALVLGNYMLGGGFLNSRLATRIRQREGLSYGIGSSVFVSALDELGSFRASATYAPQNVEKLESAFKEEIARILKEGFTAEEIAAAKSGYLQSRQVTRAQDASLANALASYLFLDRTFAWDAEFEKKIAALTPEQVVSAMRRHIDPTKIIIVKAGDFAKIVQKAPTK